MFNYRHNDHAQVTVKAGKLEFKSATTYGSTSLHIFESSCVVLELCRRDMTCYLAKGFGVICEKFRKA